MILHNFGPRSSLRTRSVYLIVIDFGRVSTIQLVQLNWRVRDAQDGQQRQYRRLRTACPRQFWKPVAPSSGRTTIPYHRKARYAEGGAVEHPRLCTPCRTRAGSTRGAWRGITAQGHEQAQLTAN